MSFKDILETISHCIQAIKKTYLFEILIFCAQVFGIYKAGKAAKSFCKAQGLKITARFDKLKGFSMDFIKVYRLKVQYNRLRISANEVDQRIEHSSSWALKGNARIDGAIIKIPVGIIEGRHVYQQFIRSNNRFYDLGIEV